MSISRCYVSSYFNHSCVQYLSLKQQIIWMLRVFIDVFMYWWQSPLFVMLRLHRLQFECVEVSGCMLMPTNELLLCVWFSLLNSGHNNISFSRKKMHCYHWTLQSLRTAMKTWNFCVNLSCMTMHKWDSLLQHVTYFCTTLVSRSLLPVNDASVNSFVVITTIERRWNNEPT